MLSIKPILLVIGTLLTVLSIAMAIPAMVDLYFNNPDWQSFAISSFLVAFIGVSLILTNQHHTGTLSLKQAFILTSASWTVLAAFSALPFVFAKMNYTDAFFESMSALTTTGATVIIGLDDMPPGLLLWRSLLQWMGGIGIIVVALAVLPMLRIGGMQLFRTESSDKSDKILPRAAQISFAIGSVYLLFTIICAVMLWGAGMNSFDAICHAMTTVATAGFSTHDASIAFFDSPRIEWIMTLFMILSGLPFVLYVQMVRGDYKPLFHDTQIRAFLILLFVCITATVLWMHFYNGLALPEAIRYSAFNITSILTTSGFASDDYASWGSFAVTLIFLLCVVGGCTGSTTGGIKIFRFQMLYQTAKMQINQLIHPHAVFRPRYNHKPVGESVTSSVMSFFILFAFCFLVLAAILSAYGLDFITSISAAAAILSNLGPALGEIAGPTGTYTSFPDGAKWLLSFTMLVGRLEIFTILVLFSSHFWRN